MTNPLRDGQIFGLSPVERWAGRRMGPSAVGERRLFAPDVSISDGRGVCGSIAEVARQLGPCLLGEGAHGRGPGCVPITIKLLDVGAWLSLQVHPESAAARAGCAASLEMTEA